MRFGLVFVLLIVGFGFSVSAISICVDNVAPEAPGSLAVSGGVGSILIEWNAAVDSPECSGIDYYNVSRDGEWIGTTENLSFIDNASLGRGEYNYSVYAVDMVGGNAGASVKNNIVFESGSVGGGGGGSSYVCKSNWSCGDWSDCVGDERRRLCEDVNKCGTPYLKPEVYEVCGEDLEGESMRLENVVNEGNVDDVEGFFSVMTGGVIGGGTGSFVAGGVLLLLSILGFIVVKRRRRS